MTDDKRMQYPLKFDGPAYDAGRDRRRLTGQINRVFALMSDGGWRPLAQIAEATGDPAASVSAQLRHLRKSRFGAYKVERRHIRGGLFEYRVLPGNGEHDTETDRTKNTARARIEELCEKNRLLELEVMELRKQLALKGEL